PRVAEDDGRRPSRARRRRPEDSPHGGAVGRDGVHGLLARGDDRVVGGVGPVAEVRDAAVALARPEAHAVAGAGAGRGSKNSGTGAGESGGSASAIKRSASAASRSSSCRVVQQNSTMMPLGSVA